MKRWVLKFASFKYPNDIFDMVLSGTKTIETRPINPASSRNYALIQPQDILVFVSLDTQERIEKSVTFVHIYKSVEDMVYSEPVDQIVPGINTSTALLDFYDEVKKKWGQDYAKKLETHDIVAIGFE